MSRQHATPVLLGAMPGEARRLQPVTGGSGYPEEAYLRDLIYANPTMLPISEIDRQFEDPVPICTELSTRGGAIDVFLVTAKGMPVLVECKLWRNAQARREVIGQILEYAKDLRYSPVSEIQRRASQRLKRPGNIILDLVRERHPDIDESDFNDALSQNLRRGRFLLLIVGDGIRQDMASIAEHVQEHAGLHFTLGMVEMPIYSTPSGERLVVPRVLAHTETILRTVVVVPRGLEVEDGAQLPEHDDDFLPGETPERRVGRMRRNATRQDFWREFLEKLQLDDPEQAFPPASRGGHIVFKFGAPGGSSWLTIYRDARNNRVGLQLSSNSNSIGERASQLLRPYAEELQRELGPSANIDMRPERPVVKDELQLRDLDQPGDREQAIQWLRGRTNDFVNALRPRIRSALRELTEE